MRLSASEAHLLVRDIMCNYGEGGECSGEKFPGAAQRQFRETLPFLVILHPAGAEGCQECVSRRLNPEALVTFCWTPPKNMRKKVTWAPPEAPALLVPASASDHCHPLGTLHVWNGTNFRHCWPSGWMDNVILTLARQATPPLESTTRQPQRRAIKGSTWPILWLLLRLTSQIHAIREVLGCMCGPSWNSCNPVLRPLLRFIPPKLSIFHNDGKMRQYYLVKKDSPASFLTTTTLSPPRPINPSWTPHSFISRYERKKCFFFQFFSCSSLMPL